MLWFVFYIVVLWFLLLKRRALCSTQRDEYNARLSFLLPFFAFFFLIIGAQASKLGVQGVISVCVHTQGAALGYTLLPFQGVSCFINLN